MIPLSECCVLISKPLVFFENIVFHANKNFNTDTAEANAKCLQVGACAPL
jgi:hypothetical protein